MIFNGAFDRNHFILVDLRKWMDDFVVRKYNTRLKLPINWYFLPRSHEAVTMKNYWKYGV